MLHKVVLNQICVRGCTKVAELRRNLFFFFFPPNLDRKDQLVGEFLEPISNKNGSSFRKIQMIFNCRLAGC